MRYLLSIIAVAAIWSQLAVSQEQGEMAQVLITNVNVFDGINEELAMGQEVLVEGNLIKGIGRHLAAAEGATVIDGGGRTLLPGLIDCTKRT